MPKRFSSKELQTTAAPGDGGTGVGVFRFLDAYSVFHLGRLPDPIPEKGRSIAAMTVANFRLLDDAGVAHHFRSQVADDAIEVDLFPILDPSALPLNGSTGAYFVPLQVIFRNSVPPGSSLLRRPMDRRFAPNPRLGVPDFTVGKTFDPPLVEFTTKLEEIDRFVSADEAAELAALDAAALDDLVRRARLVDEVVTERARVVGLDHADGKVEFGRSATGALVLVDQTGTPDENRFLLDGFHVSKQVMRDHYAATGLEKAVQDWAAAGRPPGEEPTPDPLPPELVALVAEMYASLAETWCATSPRRTRELDAVVDDLRGWSS